MFCFFCDVCVLVYVCFVMCGLALHLTNKLLKFSLPMILSDLQALGPFLPFLTQSTNVTDRVPE